MQHTHVSFEHLSFCWCVAELSQVYVQISACDGTIFGGIGAVDKHIHRVSHDVRLCGGWCIDASGLVLVRWMR